jgi:hypothetical protein
MNCSGQLSISQRMLAKSHLLGQPVATHRTHTIAISTLSATWNCLCISGSAALRLGGSSPIHVTITHHIRSSIAGTTLAKSQRSNFITQYLCPSVTGMQMEPFSRHTTLLYNAHPCTDVYQRGMNARNDTNSVLHEIFPRQVLIARPILREADCSETTAAPKGAKGMRTRRFAIQ